VTETSIADPIADWDRAVTSSHSMDLGDALPPEVRDTGTVLRGGVDESLIVSTEERLGVLLNGPAISKMCPLPWTG
jgi:hypothetical protein